MNWLTQPLSWPDRAALHDALRAWLQGGWREWAMLPARTLAACAALLFALGAWGVWLLWPSDGQDVQALTLAHQTLQSQLAAQRQRLAALQLQASAFADPAKALSAAQSAWPTRVQAQAALMALHLQAQQQGLQVEWFKPEGVVSSQGLSAQALNLRLRGSFAQLTAWSEAVFQQPALWVPEKWTLTAQPGAQASAQPGTKSEAQTGVQTSFLTGSQTGSPSPSPSPSQVTLDALLHLYLRPGEDGMLQALPTDSALGEAAKRSAQNRANSDAKPNALSNRHRDATRDRHRDAPRYAQRPDPSPRGDPFSRPASTAQRPPPPLLWGEDVHPLRRWPLQNMTMVGSFSSGGASSALVLTPAGLFRVTVGDVLGAEGARVLNLNARQIELRMPRSPGSALWTERHAVLPLRAAVKP
jgi:Tfp pilus assembly protein PilP/Tfp pilus assembly protein PilO